MGIFVIIALLNSSAIAVYASVDTLSQAKSIIRKYYVDEIPDSKLNSAKNMDELINLLNDPYTQFFSAEGFENFTNSINNKVCGIGVQIEMVPEGVNVMAVFSNSPAYEAGIKVGDIIVEADGHPLAGLLTDQSASYIKGDEGTTVTIKIKRGEEFLTYNLIRRQIVAPTVEGKMLSDGTAYIKLTTFGEDTRNEFKKTVDDLKKQKPKGYIVDIRDNPGGYLMTVREICEFFVGDNPVVTLKDRTGTYVPQPVKSDAKMFNRPVILLINGNSASASEILSAAVKDYKKAFIVGSTSFGKGTVQSPFNLQDGSILKLTVQRFYSPLGKPINKVGVTPDMESGNADPIKMGQLLLGLDKYAASGENAITVKMDGREFAMSLNKARSPEYWVESRQIIEQALQNGSVSVASSNGRMNVASCGIDNLWRVYFPGYKEAPAVRNAAVDQKFTIDLAKHVNASSLGSGDIELINAQSGERVPLHFENSNDTTIVATPNRNLEPGATYYLIAHGSAMGIKGTDYKGTAAVVTVKYQQ